MEIAISFGPLGQCPAVSLSGLKRWSPWGLMLSARLPAPCVETTLLSRSTSFVCSSVTDPSAAFTSGSACTFASRLSENPGACTGLPLSFVKAVLALMTASAFLYVWVKIDVNALLIVSVRTKVPLIIATPRMIASAVSTARSFRPARPFSATRSISSGCS